MEKRKYTRMDEEAVAYECTKRKCKWQGTECEKAIRPYATGGGEHVCPNCGNAEFYGLLYFQAVC